MRIIAKEQVQSEIAQPGRLLLAFTKPNCPNCEQTLPLLARFESANPGTRFCAVECAGGADVPAGFHFRMFPGIFAFDGGQLVRATSGARAPAQLAFAFTSAGELKVAYADALLAAKSVEREIESFGQGASYQPQAPAAHVTPAVMPPSGDPNEEACDSCV